MSFRRPENYKRYENTYIQLLKQANPQVANGGYQNRDNYTFIRNHYSNLDWYYAQILMSFKVTKLTGENIAINDNNGIVNRAHSFIKKISFSINGREVYDCKEANNSLNIKNLIDYSPSYAKTVATNEMFFLDTSTSPNRAKYLTRQNTMLPDSNFKIVIEIESDNNLIWRTGTDVCRIIITDFQVVIPQIIPVDPIARTTTLTFLNEYVTKSYVTNDKENIFRIKDSIKNPKHVYIFFLENSKLNSQTANPFIYNTLRLDTNKTLERCYLKVNKEVYPITYYSLPRDETRIYQDLTTNPAKVTLLNRYNFKELFPFIHFHLTALKDESAKLVFYYQLSNETIVNYTVYAIVI